MGKELNGHVSNKDIQMAKKQMKRCSMSLTIRKMQIKTIIRYYFTPTRMAVIKKKKSVDMNVEKLELLCIAGGNVK